MKRQVGSLFLALWLGLVLVKAKVKYLGYNEHRTKGIVVLELDAADFRKLVQKYHLKEGDKVKLPLVVKP